MKYNFVSAPSSNKNARNFISEISILAFVALAWKYVWISAVFNLGKLQIYKSTQSLLRGSKVDGGGRWMGNSA
jgi:hypothetical protein